MTREQEELYAAIDTRALAILREVAEPLVRDGVARLEPGRLDFGEGLELIPGRREAAAVEVIPSGTFILVYFGPDKHLVELMADEADGDWQEELRRMLEATVAGGLSYVLEPDPGGYRETFTFAHPNGDHLEHGAFNATGGDPDAKREERRFAAYAQRA